MIPMVNLKRPCARPQKAIDQAPGRAPELTAEEIGRIAGVIHHVG